MFVQMSRCWYWALTVHLATFSKVIGNPSRNSIAQFLTGWRSVVFERKNIFMNEFKLSMRSRIIELE